MAIAYLGTNQIGGGGGGGQDNVIEVVKVNGTALEVTDKAVNVPVPTKVSDLTNDAGYTTNTGTLTGVKFNGTTATVSSGVASITATIPSAPGTLNTNNSTAQTVSSSEALSGAIKLHKVAKTGTYSDLIGTPTIPSKTSDLQNDSGFVTSSGITSISKGTATSGGAVSTSGGSVTIQFPTVPTVSFGTQATDYVPLTIGSTTKNVLTAHQSLSSYVPTSRTINSKALSSNITLTLDDIGNGSTRSLASYLPLDGGTMTGAIQIGAYTAFGVASGTFYLGSPSYPVNLRSNGTTQINGNTIWHSGNSNKSDVAWACSTLTANGAITGVTNIDGILTFDTTNTGSSFKTKSFGSSSSNRHETPALGAMNVGTTGLCSPDGRWGLYAWSNAWHGYSCLQNGRTDGSTIIYALNLQPLGGNVGIGTMVPSQVLHVIGNILATGTISPGSDSRIKGEQTDITKEQAFYIIEKLNPKTWIWNEKSGKELNGKRAAGLIAQEVKEIIPDSVTISENGDIKDFHSLNYNTIQGYEIAAIKGLIEEIKSLKAEIAELKKQIN